MKSRVFSANNSFVLFTAAVMLLLVLPNLLQHGMFMDGTQYAIVSKNFAEGKGTFWFPFLSTSWEKQGQNYFLEHPPLVYALQSVFFKLCNGSFLSERLYCFITLFLSAFFIIKIWGHIFQRGSKYRQLYWLPVLLWIIIPSVYWSYINNMQENTMSVFVLASVYFAFKASITPSSKQYVFTIASAIFIFLATLSKGVPGLFPIVSFVLIALCTRTISWKKAISNTFLVIFILFLIYFLILYFNESARRSLSFYFRQRLMYRLNTDVEVDNRLTIFFWLLTDLVVPIALIFLAALYFKWKKQLRFSGIKDQRLKPMIIVFVLIGLCGVVPLSFTYVQRAVYFVPALPLFSIAIALLLADEFTVMLDQIQSKASRIKIFFTSVSIILVSVVVFSILNFGKTSRDEEVLDDVGKIASVTGNDAEIYSYYSIYSQWGFQFYLLRYHNITLDSKQKGQKYVLINKEDNLEDVNYTEVDLDLSAYKLLKRIN